MLGQRLPRPRAERQLGLVLLRRRVLQVRADLRDDLRLQLLWLFDPLVFLNSTDRLAKAFR